jgi:ribosomal protein RSM22 (predicted rRNA methylase)
VSVELPPPMAAAINAHLAGLSPRDLTRASAELSTRYRESRQRRAPVARSQADLLAYLAVRLPATYAAVSAALTAVQAQRPGWQPRSLLDLGAGPGTVLWSAASRWPSVEQAVAVERQPEMIVLGRWLAQAGPPAVRQATWRQADLAVLDATTLATLGGPFDLTILAYVLGELPSSAVPRLLDGALRATASDGLLLLVEPGTPDGFARIRDARAALLAEGGHVIVPCPHDAPCPVPPDDWCHFSVRLPRTAAHRAAKGGALGYEDEKFAYVAVSRTPTPQAAARVLRHPLVRPRLIQLTLCTPTGLETRTVTRADREGFRAARKTAWGDAWHR